VPRLKLTQSVQRRFLSRHSLCLLHSVNSTMRPFARPLSPTCVRRVTVVQREPTHRARRMRLQPTIQTLGVEGMPTSVDLSQHLQRTKLVLTDTTHILLGLRRRTRPGSGSCRHCDWGCVCCFYRDATNRQGQVSEVRVVGGDIQRYSVRDGLFKLNPPSRPNYRPLANTLLSTGSR